LVGYSYKDFKADMAEWLVTGRMIWFFCGNFATQDALAIVNNARD
jgi:hypothetical protein